MSRLLCSVTVDGGKVLERSLSCCLYPIDGGIDVFTDWHWRYGELIELALEFITSCDNVIAVCGVGCLAFNERRISFLGGHHGRRWEVLRECEALFESELRRNCFEAFVIGGIRDLIWGDDGHGDYYNAIFMAHGVWCGVVRWV